MYGFYLYNNRKRVPFLQAALTISLRRVYTSFLLNTFLPCFILEVISIATHFLPLDDYQDRVSVTLSCLIVMASLFAQVNYRLACIIKIFPAIYEFLILQQSSTLPKTAEPKFIDIWMFAHITILALVFWDQIILINIEKFQSRKRNKVSSDKVYPIIVPSVRFSFILILRI